MRITSIRLKNFGGHAEFKKDLTGAVVGILGQNGSGKSTLLAAIEYALTGNLPARSGNQETFVKLGAKTAEVELTFEHQAKLGKILRKFGGTNKRELIWDGGAPETKEADIARQMSEILSADKETVASAIFVGQGDLNKMLFGTSTTRQALMARMMLLTYLEKVADAADQRAKIVGAGVQDLGPVKDELVMQRSQLEAEIVGMLGCDRKFEALKKDVDQLKALDAATNSLQRADSDAQTAAVGLKETEGRVNAYLASSKETSNAVTALSANRAKLVELKSRQQKADAITAEIRRLKTDEETQTRLNVARAETKRRYTEALLLSGDMESEDDLRTEISNIEKHIGVVVEEVQRFDTLAEWSKELNALKAVRLLKEEAFLKAESAWELLEASSIRSDLEILRQTIKLGDMIKSVGGLAGGRCPICKSSDIDASHFSDEAIAEMKRKELKLKSEIETLGTAFTKAKDALDDATKAVSEKNGEGAWIGKLPEDFSREASMELIPKLREDLRTKKQRLQEVITFNQDFLKLQTGMKEQPTVVFSEEKASRLKELLETPYDEVDAVEVMKIENHIENLEKLIEAIADAKTRLKQATEILDSRKADISKALAEVPARLKGVRVAELEVEMDAASEALGKLRSLKTRNDEIEVRLKELEAKMKLDERRRDIVEQLKQIKEAFSPRGIIQTYVRYRFGRMLPKVRRWLADMNASFDVELDPDDLVSYQFKRIDGEAVSGDDMLPQVRLSGGQRVRLSLAFLLALQEEVLPEIGFLSVDEPSMHLDTDGVAHLGEVLTDIGRTFGGSGSQVLVVDHNLDLVPAFDDVIRLT